METNSCIVIPSNDDKEVTIYTDCQSLSSLQQLTAQVLDRDVSQIICRMKRVGGAFGGKESRTIPLCIAAVKTGRPVRMNLDRHTDISITGHRNPFKIKYKIAFNQQGQFLGLEISMWNNAGCTLDASKAVMELAMLHMGNVYRYWIF